MYSAKYINSFITSQMRLNMISENKKAANKQPFFIIQFSILDYQFIVFFILLIASLMLSLEFA